MSDILLSIIIPTFNRKQFLAEAVASICGNLSFHSEIIVLDNASTDGTAEWAADFTKLAGAKLGLKQEFFYYRNKENLGMVGNWIEGLKKIRGKYVKVLCDDDLILPGALEREVAALERYPQAMLCASARQELLRTGQENAASPHSFTNSIYPLGGSDHVLDSDTAIRTMLKLENIFGPPSSVCFRATEVIFSGPFVYAADWAAWIRLSLQGESIFLATPGCIVNLHAGNLTKQMVERDIDYLEVFELRWTCLKLLEKRNEAQLTDYIYFYLIVFYRVLRRLTKHLLSGNPGRIPIFLHAWILLWKSLLTNGPRL